SHVPPTPTPLSAAFGQLLERGSQTVLDGIPPANDLIGHERRGVQPPAISWSRRPRGPASMPHERISSAARSRSPAPIRQRASSHAAPRSRYVSAAARNNAGSPVPAA